MDLQQQNYIYYKRTVDNTSNYAVEIIIMRYSQPHSCKAIWARLLIGMTNQTSSLTRHLKLD